MTKYSLSTAVAAAAALLSSAVVVADDKTVKLAVDNMSCAACPYMVKETLTLVDGVKAVDVSYPDRTAVVTYDDALTGVDQLTAATAGLGYPSRQVR